MGRHQGKALDGQGVGQPSAQIRHQAEGPQKFETMQDEFTGETWKLVLRGYERGDFLDAWKRYLGAPPDGSATSATSATGAAE